jgi:hypothetical protein
MAFCSRNQHFAQIDSDFHQDALEGFNRSPGPSASGQIDARADFRYTVPVDFFDQLRSDETYIGAFSSLIHEQDKRQPEALRVRFRLQVMDGTTSRVSMYDQESGGNLLRCWLIGPPESLRQERMDSWLLVLREGPSGDLLDVWAKGRPGAVFCASIDPSTGLDSKEEISLNPIVSFSDAIAFASCNHHGETVVTSPKGLLVVPRNAK